MSWVVANIKPNRFAAKNKNCCRVCFRAQLACVCVRVIYAMSWNSNSENPFHRKNDLIEFSTECSEVKCSIFLPSTSLFYTRARVLSSFTSVYFQCVFSVWLWLIEFATKKYWPRVKITAFWRMIIFILQAKKKVDHDSTWELIQVRKRVSISWNSVFCFVFYLLIYLTIYLFFAVFVYLHVILF